jgi:hypothetical protein
MCFSRVRSAPFVSHKGMSGFSSRARNFLIDTYSIGSYRCSGSVASGLAFLLAMYKALIVLKRPSEDFSASNSSSSLYSLSAFSLLSDA